MNYDRGVLERRHGCRHCANSNIPGCGWMRVCVYPCGKEIVISLNVAGSVGRRWWKGGAAFSQACCISSHIVCSRQNETQAQTTLSGTKTVISATHTHILWGHVHACCKGTVPVAKCQSHYELLMQ